MQGVMSGQMYRADPNENLLLEVAARIRFPDGKVTARVLRQEANRGRLNISRVGKRLYTTLTDVDRMIEGCRVKAKAPVSHRNTLSRKGEADLDHPRLNG
jgi:hypothetical protein